MRSPNRHNVRYVVFGSFAGSLQGADLRTLDVDIVADARRENLQCLADALNGLAPRWRVALGGADVLVGSLEDLILSKQLLRREKDLVHLPELLKRVEELSREGPEHPERARGRERDQGIGYDIGF